MVKTLFLPCTASWSTWMLVRLIQSLVSQSLAVYSLPIVSITCSYSLSVSGSSFFWVFSSKHLLFQVMILVVYQYTTGNPGFLLYIHLLTPLIGMAFMIQAVISTWIFLISIHSSSCQSLKWRILALYRSIWAAKGGKGACNYDLHLGAIDIQIQACPISILGKCVSISGLCDDCAYA